MLFFGMSGIPCPALCTFLFWIVGVALALPRVYHLTGFCAPSLYPSQQLWLVGFIIRFAA
jgi:uncharacterized membrane protein YecN with MAPEG domain